VLTVIVGGVTWTFSQVKNRTSGDQSPILQNSTGTVAQSSVKSNSGVNAGIISGNVQNAARDFIVNHMTNVPSHRRIGKDTVVYGNVPHDDIGDGSVVIGATDSNGNTIIQGAPGGLAAGSGAQAAPGGIAIGKGARAGYESISIGAHAGGGGPPPQETKASAGTN
jgi:hypothetical protein